jgi:hypothetical protein
VQDLCVRFSTVATIDFLAQVDSFTGFGDVMVNKGNIFTSSLLAIRSGTCFAYAPVGNLNVILITHICDSTDSPVRPVTFGF